MSNRGASSGDTDSDSDSGPEEQFQRAKPLDSRAQRRMEAMDDASPSRDDSSEDGSSSERDGDGSDGNEDEADSSGSDASDAMLGSSSEEDDTVPILLYWLTLKLQPFKFRLKGLNP